MSLLRSLRKDLLQYKAQYQDIVDEESFRRVYQGQGERSDCWLVKSIHKFDLHQSTTIHLEEKGIR